MVIAVGSDDHCVQVGIVLPRKLPKLWQELLAWGAAGLRKDMEQRPMTKEFFFFSSRSRHTRFSRDWSSDVCSSDLCSCASPARMKYLRMWAQHQSGSDRKSAVQGKSVDLAGRRISKKKKNILQY